MEKKKKAKPTQLIVHCKGGSHKELQVFAGTAGWVSGFE